MSCHEESVFWNFSHLFLIVISRRIISVVIERNLDDSTISFQTSGDEMEFWPACRSHGRRRAIWPSKSLWSILIFRRFSMVVFSDRNMLDCALVEIQGRLRPTQSRTRSVGRVHTVFMKDENEAKARIKTMIMVQRVDEIEDFRFASIRSIPASASFVCGQLETMLNVLAGTRRAMPIVMRILWCEKRKRETGRKDQILVIVNNVSVGNEQNDDDDEPACATNFAERFRTCRTIN